MSDSASWGVTSPVERPSANDPVSAAGFQKGVRAMRNVQYLDLPQTAMLHYLIPTSARPLQCKCPVPLGHGSEARLNMEPY